MSSASVNELTASEVRDLQLAWQAGLIGPLKDYSLAYINYVAVHNVREATIAAATGKKYKQTKPVKFSEMFEVINHFANLETGQEKPNLAEKFAKLFATKDMPEHLKERLRGNRS